MNSFSRLRSRISRSDSDRGAVLVLTALVMLLLLFVAAFATDLGAWYRQGSEQQRAADVGALNGIASFDRTARAELEALGAVRWDDVSDATALEAVERASLESAVDQVQALLETAGFTFSSGAVYNIATDPNPANPDPTNPAQQSTATLTADDGTVITITRGFAETGIGVDGVTPTFTRFVDVSITRDGEQFFSNLIREAPQIQRSGQSLLSNCGATCDNTIIINPPFVGFQGTGNGDGYGPQLFDRDGDGTIDEAWAVNHHSNGANDGQIICVLVDSTPAGQPCPGSNASNNAWALNYQTGNRPVEFQADDGKIYFAARNRSNNRLGIACFDPATKDYCNNEFISFWTQSAGTNFPSFINAHGPFEFDGRLYIVSQNGEVGCATLTLTSCGTPNAQTIAGSDTSELPGLNSGNFVTNGEQNGSTLIVTQNAQRGVLFRCLNLSNPNGAVGHCGEHFETSLANGGDDNLTFTRFSANPANPSANTPIGVCVLHIQNGNNECVNWSAAPQGELPGLRSGLSQLGAGNWGGDTFTWDTQRTFFGGGESDRVGCWNWNIQGPCNDDLGAYLVANNAFTGLGNANPYAFNQISDRCILGLGHRAVFFSFDPEGFGPCTDVQITTDIEPCFCDDENAGSRWAEVTLPADLLADVTLLEATVRLPDGSIFSIDGQPTTDLLATGGVLDLTGLNAVSPDRVQLTIDADSALDINGNPEFDTERTATLSVSSQPTLTQ